MKFFNLALLVSFCVCLISCGPDLEKEKVYPKATHLYFSNYAAKEVGVMDVNTIDSYNTLADENDGLDIVSGIAIDFESEKIYAVEENNNRIVRFNADGSGALEVLFDEEDSVNFPTSITLDIPRNKLYWANSGTGQLKTGSMDGGAASSLKFKNQFNVIDSISYCYGLAIDPKGETLFWSDLEKGTISYGTLKSNKDSYVIFNIESSNRTVLRNPSSIYLDWESSRIYWADEGLNVISVGSFVKYSSIAIAGSNSVALFNYEDGINRPDGIAVDKGSRKIYWSETNTGNHKIYRGNLDGTEAPEVVLNDVESYGLVLKFEDQ